MYDWRKMSDEERRAILKRRISRGGSWRRTPIWESGKNRYLITAACYEHAVFIGATSARIEKFEESVLNELNRLSSVYAHVVLPNHYHALVETNNVTKLRTELGKFHGRTSFQWNKEDNRSGRKIFHGSAETVMKSERHFQATMNYIHHNPVKHGYTEKWQDWPFSSAAAYLAAVGEAEARKQWVEYPIESYGDSWDK